MNCSLLLKNAENYSLRMPLAVWLRLMKVFTASADQLLIEDENTVVDIQNSELNEQLAMINQLDEDEKNALVKIINSMLTKKRMKDLLDGKVNF